MTSRESWALTPATEKVTLADCPIGLFVNSFGRICLKTEYGNNAGRIDAYIVDSGEFFWGEHPQTIENQRKQLVTPLTCASSQPNPTPPAEVDVAEGLHLLNEEQRSWRAHEDARIRGQLTRELVDAAQDANEAWDNWALQNAPALLRAAGKETDRIACVP